MSRSYKVRFEMRRHDFTSPGPVLSLLHVACVKSVLVCKPRATSKLQ